MDFTRLRWDELERHQGEPFFTAKKLPFTYSIKGGEMFVDRRSKSITRATFEKAVEKLKNDTEHRITGPKSLCCFGAPYVWAVIQSLGNGTGDVAQNGMERNFDHKEAIE